MKTAEERFWAKVQKTDSCWLWTGFLSHRGYGGFSFGKDFLPAHRHSYAMHYGPIPTGLQVLHSCDVRNCVNPAHLFLGTNADNMADRNKKGREAHGEKNGQSKLTESAVKEIFRHSRNGMTQRRIADIYGVHHSQIGKVLRGETWKHVSSKGCQQEAA